ncbi:replication factor C subunit 5-like [Octopus vulgaris]|uniref:Replication factor C subunit 5-like n=2 Tax=Octopus TaxID=6643 RepID=A0AA36FJK4_OCTVU|nr:replication factor C subunit 5 isoform X2 [Octopus sinensis]XP_036369416.1 replication factor C subunit 5 isoform X2 [Octopus sinensis]CAI9741350.1 replication factor C subunit 5-like [Octopus vulgaris]
MDGGNKERSNLPWIEKYRPQNLEELISHNDIVNTIKKFVSEDRLPHLLFYGPPGTGKTSTILAVAKQIYSPKEFNSMVLELNASDDRGIGIVRENILSFASTRTIFKSGFKLVILDEADAMTRDAQNALRRVIEKFTENTRFCIICNYLSKIIPALQSRCTRFRFAPLSTDQMLPRLEHVIKQEGVNVTQDGMKAIVTLACGDMRRSLNILQSASMAFDEVTEDNVYLCVGHPLRKDIENIVQWLLNSSFTEAYKNILQLKSAKGLALQDILTEVHVYVHRIDFPVKIRIHLLDKMAETEYRLMSGTNERIQLGSVVSAFQVVRDTIVEEAAA